MMRKRTVIVSVALVVSCCLLVAGLYFFTLFLSNGGIVHSSNFTWEKFASVKRGEHVDAVIARLGWHES